MNKTNVVIIGAGGFIGTNLSIYLAKTGKYNLILVDRNDNFEPIRKLNLLNIDYVISDCESKDDFKKITKNSEIVYYLLSTNVPGTSNINISAELTSNTKMATNFLEACVENNVKKVVFPSSGGAVYGKGVAFPIKEDSSTSPITTYGLQKLIIEKLIYLYSHLYGFDYRIIRLSNLYGPYQKPDGVFGVVANFVYNAIRKEELAVYGDGSIVRDFMYIDDAIRGIVNIVNGDSKNKLFNLGTGCGTSINELLDLIEKNIKSKLKVKKQQSRIVDVSKNYLDINLYEKTFGKLELLSMDEGIKKTVEFMCAYITNESK